MKSNRMRYETPQGQFAGSRSDTDCDVALPMGRVSLAEMPPPAAIKRISPEQVVTDILVNTLLKVQKSSSPEIAAVAEKYLALLR